MKFKKYISVSLLSLLVLSNANLSFANTNKIKQERLIGNLRYQTAVEVSKYGWFKADSAVVVSGFDLMSSLCSTPLVKLKQAPILLIEENKLTDDTKTELIRLGVKNVYLVESGNRLSAKVIEAFYPNNSIPSNPTSSISIDKSRAVILVRFPGASILKLKYDRENHEYEADIRYKNRYYEVTVSAFNGQILEIDLDD